MIELFDDFRDILVELHNAAARFVVLGGHAVAFHGHPRATKDLDVLVEANAENAKRVYTALAAFSVRRRGRGLCVVRWCPPTWRATAAYRHHQSRGRHHLCRSHRGWRKLQHRGL